MPSWSPPSIDYENWFSSSPAVEEAYEEILRRRREIEARDRVSYEMVLQWVEKVSVKPEPPKRKKSGFAKFVSRIEGK